MLSGLISQSVFLGVLITLGAWFLALALRKRFDYAFVNPLLIAVVLTIALLLATRTPYQTYYDGAKYLSYLLTPATVCLAIPLYEQLEA
ncbi:MAG: LrgB family protein, partial [Firmicutes bacterium]|nr:LrgB family protein [Bacillota bacterium]